MNPLPLPRANAAAGTARSILACGVIAFAWVSTAQAQATTEAAPPVTLVRPALMTDRWREDWSPLADPGLRTEPLDGLKYIGLSPSDPERYISLGLNLRERFESNHAPGFGVGGTPGDSYLLQRLQFSIDAHPAKDWQLFTQFEDDRAFGKQTITPTDKDQLDLRLAFLGYSHTYDDGTLKARVGRQDFLFDLQRFVSSRDGPNIRQSFDAAWLDWESGPWRFIGFVSQPVQYKDIDSFDDTSNKHVRFDTLRVERHVLGTNELSAYYSRYDQDNAHYLDASGNERRDVFDTRFAGELDNVDWDLETMGQTGTVGSKKIRAWALGTRTGYTFQDTPWHPRIGLQIDAASGDKHPGDNTLGTFNPLFPNGYYFTRAGYTGYTNLIHVKPSLTVKPTEKLSLMGAVGFQWRETTADAVYLQPNNPVAGTAGQGSNWTGAYGQLQANYTFNRHLSGTIDAVRYQVGSAIRQAGGHDSNYIAAELRFAW